MRRLHDLCDGQGLDWAGPRGSGEDGVHEPMRYLAGVLQGVRQLHPAKIYFARLVWINPFCQEIVIGTVDAKASERSRSSLPRFPNYLRYATHRQLQYGGMTCEDQWPDMTRIARSAVSRNTLGIGSPGTLECETWHYSFSTKLGPAKFC